MQNLPPEQVSMTQQQAPQQPTGVAIQDGGIVVHKYDATAGGNAEDILREFFHTLAMHPLYLAEPFSVT
jgi:hypothetical protein